MRSFCSLFSILRVQKVEDDVTIMVVCFCKKSCDISKIRLQFW